MYESCIRLPIFRPLWSRDPAPLQQVHGRRWRADNGWATGAYRWCHHSEAFPAVVVRSPLQLLLANIGDHVTRTGAG